MTLRNHWLDIFRIVSCYGVISIHFGKNIFFDDWAVPVFMLLASYYSTFTDCCWLKKRLARIFVPFAAWGFFAFIVRSLVGWQVDPMMLILQMLVGAPANSPLYFMSVLMIVTILLFAVLRSGGGSKTLWGIICVLFTLQYSGVNGCMWRWLPLPAEITMGRIIELMPYAVVGVILNRKKNKTMPFFCLGIGLMIIGVFARYFVGDYGAQYNYGGIVRVIGVTGLFMCGISLDVFLPVRNRVVASCIVYASSLTAGIYYMHKIIGELVVRMGLFGAESVALTMMIFILCATAVHVLRRIGFGRIVA